MKFHNHQDKKKNFFFFLSFLVHPNCWSLAFPVNQSMIEDILISFKQSVLAEPIILFFLISSPFFIALKIAFIKNPLPVTGREFDPLFFLSKLDS